MSKQDLFDKVSSHLLKQNKRAGRTDDGCYYRTEEGLSCAVGCLIDDKFYDPAIEGYTVDDEDVSFILQRSLGRELSVEEFDLLADLQTIHDMILPIKWRDKLREVADKYELKVNFCV